MKETKQEVNRILNPKTLAVGKFRASDRNSSFYYSMPKPFPVRNVFTQIKSPVAVPILKRHKMYINKKEIKTNTRKRERERKKERKKERYRNVTETIQM